MSRSEGEFTAAREVAIGAADLLKLAAEHSGLSPEQRQQAIACCLSGSEGWRDALQALGGAFSDTATATRLKSEKAG